MKTTKKQNEIHILIEKTKVNKPWQWEVDDYEMCRNYDEAYNIICKRNELDIYNRDNKGRFCTKFANTIENGNRVSIISFCYGDSSYRTGDGYRLFEIVNINDLEPYDWAKIMHHKQNTYWLEILIVMGFQFTWELVREILQANTKSTNYEFCQQIQYILRNISEVFETEDKTNPIYYYNSLIIYNGSLAEEFITIDFDNETITIE